LHYWRCSPFRQLLGGIIKFFSASLISVFFLFIILVSIFFAAAIVGIPHLYVTKGKFKDAARALRIPRIEFVLSAIWAVLIFIVTFLLSLDAYAFRKCNPSDPKYDNFTSGPSNQTFSSGLPGSCRTQRAANAFGWFALVAWLCSLVFIANDWRKHRRPPKSQGPITYSTQQNKPSASSISSSVEEHGLPDTSTQPTPENVPMQTIHSTPPQPPHQQQPYNTPSPSFPHSPPINYQQQPPLGPSGIPGIPEPQFPGSGQGRGQGQSPGQGSGISFPEPQRYNG